MGYLDRLHLNVFFFFFYQAVVMLYKSLSFLKHIVTAGVFKEKWDLLKETNNIHKAEPKCQDIPLHTVETESVLTIKKRCIDFLLNKRSAVRGQYVHMLMHLRCCLHHPARQHVRPEKPHQYWTGRREKPSIFLWCHAESIRAYSPKHFSVPEFAVSPTAARNPPLRDKKQSNQSNNESIKQPINWSLNQSVGHCWHPSVKSV